MATMLSGLTAVAAEVEADVDVDLDMMGWALIAAGVALVLLGAVPFVRSPATVRGLHTAALLLGAVVVVLAVVRLV